MYSIPLLTLLFLLLVLLPRASREFPSFPPRGPRRRAIPIPTLDVTLESYHTDPRLKKLVLSKVSVLAQEAKLVELRAMVAEQEAALGLLPNPHSPTYAPPAASEADLNHTSARVTETERAAAVAFSRATASEERADRAEARVSTLEGWIHHMENLFVNLAERLVW